MCIAVPGQVIEIRDGLGRVDIRGNILPVELGLVQAKVGDRVLVHAGCAIAVVPPAEADELDDLLTQLNAYENEGHFDE